MAEAAVASTASAAPATTAPVAAPNATDTSADAANDTADEKAPDPEEELEKHVQHAVRAGKRKEAAKKAAEAKAAKSAPAKPEKDAPAPEKKPEAKADAEPDAAADAAEEPEREKPRRGMSAKQLLEAGDIEGAFMEAFGKKPGDFQITSARWEEFRRVQQREKQKLAQRTQQVNDLIERASKDARSLLPFREAKQLYESGDYEGALRHAFGASFDDFQRGLLKQYHGRNPEVEALKAELERDRQERLRERQEYQAQRERQQLEQQERQFVESLTSTIAGSDDGQLAALSRKPVFIRRVYALMQEHYDSATDTTLPVLEAADMARRELVDHFGDVFGSRDAGAPAVSVRGGSNLAKPAAPAARTISQHGASETSAPPSGAHGLDLDTQVNAILRQFGHGR